MPDRPDVPDFAVVLRGYDRSQVEDYVSRLIVDLDEMHVRAVAAEQRAAQVPAPAASGFAELGTHVAAVLQRATDEATSLRAAAEQYAQQVRAEADCAADDLRTLTEREQGQALAQAQAVAGEARARADELLQRAQRHADQRAAEVLVAAQAEATALHEKVAALHAQHEQALAQARSAAQRLLQATDGDRSEAAVYPDDHREQADVTAGGGSRVLDLDDGARVRP